MNLLEFCERFRISLKKARLMDKAGVLRLDASGDAFAPDIRLSLARGQPLSAAQLCQLVEDPGILLDLGRYAGAASAMVEELGKAREEAAPKHVAAYVSDAARGDDEAVSVLVEWIKSIVPARQVNHSYIGVRLLLGLAPSVRKFDVPRIPRALLECRRREEFAGFWKVEQTGAKSKTWYSRPSKKALAKLDL